MVEPIFAMVYYLGVQAPKSALSMLWEKYIKNPGLVNSSGSAKKATQSAPHDTIPANHSPGYLAG